MNLIFFPLVLTNVIQLNGERVKVTKHNIQLSNMSHFSNSKINLLTKRSKIAFILSCNTHISSQFNLHVSSTKISM